MNAKKPASANVWVDPDDAPELTEEFFARADEFVGKELVRRGRPPGSIKPDRKQAVKIRLDPDVLAALRATGEGWQTRINETLRASLRLGGRV
jgi:uncharacterized protein (DUF4415 family)